MPEDARKRREEMFKEADDAYQNLISDPQNRETRRQPNAKIKDFYRKAHFYYDKDRLGIAIHFINTALNIYKDRLGIRREMNMEYS